jgi:hypothetical protein
MRALTACFKKCRGGEIHGSSMRCAKFNEGFVPYEDFKVKPLPVGCTMAEEHRRWHIPKRVTNELAVN